MGNLRLSWKRLLVATLVVAPPASMLACYSVDGLVGPGVAPADAAPEADTGPDAPPDAPSPPADADAGTDGHDAEDSAITPFDAACGTPAFSDDFDDPGVDLNLWSPDFSSGNGVRIEPGRGDAGGAAELSVDPDAIGYAQLGYSMELTDRTVVRFFFRVTEATAAVNVFEALNGPNFRIVVEAPTGDAGAPERTITAYVPGNTAQRWVNIRVNEWHEMQVVLDKRKTDGGFMLVAQVTLDDMFVRSFPARFLAPEVSSFFLTARRVVARPARTAVEFDDARFWACTPQDE